MPLRSCYAVKNITTPDSNHDNSRTHWLVFRVDRRGVLSVFDPLLEHFRTNWKVPLAENAPQTCSLGECFELGLTAISSFLQQRQSLPPDSQIDISSLNTTRPQSVFLFCFAQETRAALCLSLNIGIFLVYLRTKPRFCNSWRIVSWEYICWRV